REPVGHAPSAPRNQGDAADTDSRTAFYPSRAGCRPEAPARSSPAAWRPCRGCDIKRPMEPPSPAAAGSKRFRALDLVNGVDESSLSRLARGLIGSEVLRIAAEVR